MYEMKQLSQRKAIQLEAAAYFDDEFNNTHLSIAEQNESIIQYYLKAASMDKKSNSKSEPNGRAMSKAMEMFNGQGRGAEFSSAKDTAYGLLCSITEFVDHERRAMSRAWFGRGATIKQRGMEQTFNMIK